ncbi:MAG: carboxypeptidase regulatory-like domain-containing protein, partial [Isosphaeraceae bacterium]
MNSRNRIDRQTWSRRARIRRNRPSLEVCEPRLLMATGFVQGFALTSTGAAIPEATVQLLDPSTNAVDYTTTTGSNGYYAFNNVPTGTYNVNEIASGYTVSGTNINTTINHAMAMSLSGKPVIQVTVETLPQSLSVDYTQDPYAIATAYYALDKSSYNPAGSNDLSGGDEVGGFDLTLGGNLGTATKIVSDCSDLLDDINGYDTSTAGASLTPLSTTLTSNIGELGYLYNTYGTPFSNPDPTVPYPAGYPSSPGFGNSVNGAGLQLALWALEYNPGPVTSLSSPNSPFAVNLSSTPANIITAANTYLADAIGKSQDVYFLNITKAGSEGGQGMLSTDLLNFANTSSTNISGGPSISTTAGGTVVLGSGATLNDSATLAGGNNPGNSITFYLFAPGVTPLPDDSNNVYSDMVPVNGNGTYTTADADGSDPGGYPPTAIGTYQWIASYSGDLNNLPVSTTLGDEPEAVSPATPTINTSQVPATATIGGTIADQATVTGGYNPNGTVTFNLYNNSNGTGPALFTDTEALSGGVATSAGYIATATGTDYWVATYNSSDSNNVSVSSGTADEPVIISAATPAINTSQVPATATVGGTIADQATVTGGYNPNGTVTFNLYNNSNGTGPALFTDTEALSGGVATSAGYIATATGTDYWVATYNSSDSNNVSVSSG